MKQIKYGVFCEDTAHHTFIRYYLNFISALHPIQFEEIPKFRNIKPVAGDKSRVNKHLSEAASFAFALHYANMFIGVRDVDSHKEKDWIETDNSLMKSIEYQIRKHCILALPVQCIEHWLWYIKRYGENPHLNQPLETQPRKAAKIEVYGTLKPGSQGKNKVEILCTSFDFENIIHKSRSFLAFHTSIKKFIKSQLEQTSKPV